MIIVTGGAGFIGSHLIEKLNAQGEDNIWIIEDLKNGHQFTNLLPLKFQAYFEYEDFLNRYAKKQFQNLKIDAIFHQGACTDTQIWDGKFMLEKNYTCSKAYFDISQEKNCPFIYASSAAVYGQALDSTPALKNEKPLNIYAYSKWLFDQYIRQQLPTSKHPIIGLRYFNAYGPRETHKGQMASMVHHVKKAIEDQGYCTLFGAWDGYAPGEQARDFIYVDDIVKVNLWFLEQCQKSGIYNLGTGQARTFNDLAQAVINAKEKGSIRYIDFPQALKGHYQSFTQANINGLKEAGYTDPFYSLEQGVKMTLHALES